MAREPIFSSKIPKYPIVMMKSITIWKPKHKICKAKICIIYHQFVYVAQLLGKWFNGFNLPFKNTH